MEEDGDLCGWIHSERIVVEGNFDLFIRLFMEAGERLKHREEVSPRRKEGGLYSPGASDGVWVSFAMGWIMDGHISVRRARG